jgi:phage terminase small subunit
MVDSKLTSATSGDTKDMSIKYPKDGAGLTDKQKVFVKIYSENEGRLTPTECARQAGYSENSANVSASLLLNGKRYPKVVDALIARRAELEKTHEVKLNKHVQELARLRDKSLAEKSYSAAVNAERLRGQAAGLYIDRKEIRTGSIDSMSRDEVLSKLKEIGIDGKFKKQNNKTVLSLEEKSDSKELKDITPVQSKGSKKQKEV